MANPKRPQELLSGFLYQLLHAFDKFFSTTNRLPDFLNCRSGFKTVLIALSQCPHVIKKEYPFIFQHLLLTVVFEIHANTIMTFFPDPVTE